MCKTFSFKKFQMNKFELDKVYIMWLKIVYSENDIANWPEKPENISVFIDLTTNVLIPESNKSFRVSPIFPLLIGNTKEDISNSSIYFFSLSNAFRALGRIEAKGSDELKSSTFFSIGLCSVILILDNKDLLTDFEKLIEQDIIAQEIWNLKDNKIFAIDYIVKAGDTDITYPDILIDYSVLNITERALVDEFRVCIKLLMLKLLLHMKEERNKFSSLVSTVELMVGELVYLHTYKGEIPETLSEYSENDLQDNKLKNIIWHQSIDRIIQINSALSYVSTQAFSGAIPILERRSLLRRNSLLGTGSTILALNRIATYIENVFQYVDFKEVIINTLNRTPALGGIKNVPFPSYDSSNWSQSSLNIYFNKNIDNRSYGKLPYFSGRLSYRETEFSISAAIQSISSGAGLEWSLLTLTHEMLHGHVRILLTSIFYGNDSSKSEIDYPVFYEKFKNKIEKKSTKEYQIDSIRSIILSYCLLTHTHGSLTNLPKDNWQNVEIRLTPEKDLWKIFANENRNLSEIFVHVLDLHYFYAGRVTVYISLIWSSWLSVPHINGDLRQYILRSLLAIASTLKYPPNQRFNTSKGILIDVLKNIDKSKSPVLTEMIDILNNDDFLMLNYFPSFWISLCVVDLVTEVFYCPSIRAELFNDELISWATNEEDEDEIEQRLIYNLPNGFNDEKVGAPLAYLLDRMTRELDSNAIMDLERETAIQFLAINSFK